MSGPKATPGQTSPPGPMSPPSEASGHGLEQATALQPVAVRPGDERFVAHLATAGELVAASRFREAEVEVLRALSGLPADLRALNLLALVRFKLGRLEEARATYREIATSAPNDAAARRSLGLLSLKLEHLDEAIAELEMAARLSPHDQQAWSYLGYAYAKKGDTVRAAAAFRRAGQDALAVELEHASTARRPASGPKLAALAPRSGAATPPPAAAPSMSSSTPEVAVVRARTGSATPAPAGVRAMPSEVSAVHAPLVLPPPAETARKAARASSPASHFSSDPSSDPSSAPTFSPFPTASDLVPVAAPANGVAPVVAGEAAPLEPAAPQELAPVPLLGFVLARLGYGPSAPAPEGEALRLGVDDEAFVRADAALAATGVRVEPAFRRTQGRAGAVPLSGGGLPFFRLVGPGEVWIAGTPRCWQAVSLEDDILYVREDRVLAFDGGVSWEAGAVPGDGLRMLQFRGRGCVVLTFDAPPVAIKVTEDRPAYVGRANLLGWVGRLVTHKQRVAGPTPFGLACQGEGVVLLNGGAKG